jgi:hypothetical protein
MIFTISGKLNSNPNWALISKARVCDSRKEELMSKESKKRNALKHGANAQKVMLWGEKYEDYESLRAELDLEFTPLWQYGEISGPNTLGSALAQTAPRLP